MDSRIAARALRIVLLLIPLAIARAEAPHATPPVSFDALLLKGDDLERTGHWGQALQLYEEAAKSHPNSELLRDRLRHCEIRYGLVRRYHDTSFRAKLLGLPRSQSFRLYDEVTRKIEEYYVEASDPAKMFRAGVDNLFAACEDEEFRRTNLPGAPDSAIAQFCEQLRRWQAAPVRDRVEARQHLLSITALAENLLGIRPAPVVLEFVYGACDALDDYSTYLTPDRLGDLYALIDGNFVGIGVELRSDEQGLLVVHALVGGPAAEAGIRAGDHIVTIESTATAGLATEEAANLLQGPEGTPVQLWIQTPGESTPRRLFLRRRPVEVQSVSAAHLIVPAEGIGYVQLSAFQKTTLAELERAVARLQQQHMRSLILDLRGNPGGLLTAAVDISDKFLSEGIIVSTRGRAEGQSYTHRAQHGNTWTFPLVVIIDGESASASEILAGAIQDNHRGTVIGVRSFGKGSVQSIFPLDTADAGIRLTTAHFYSPKGRAYSHQGVSPDIEVARDTPWRPSGTTISELDPARDPQLTAAIQSSRQLIGKRN